MRYLTKRYSGLCNNGFFHQQKCLLLCIILYYNVKIFIEHESGQYFWFTKSRKSTTWEPLLQVSTDHYCKVRLYKEGFDVNCSVEVDLKLPLLWTSMFLTLPCQGLRFSHTSPWKIDFSMLNFYAFFIENWKLNLNCRVPWSLFKIWYGVFIFLGHTILFSTIYLKVVKIGEKGHSTERVKWGVSNIELRLPLVPCSFLSMTGVSRACAKIGSELMPSFIEVTHVAHGIHLF